MRGDRLGLERRRRWSGEEKLGIVLSVGVEGATVTQVAQRRDVTRQQLYAWRPELKKKGLLSPLPETLFLPVELNAPAELVAHTAAEAQTPQRPVLVELQLANGRCLRFDAMLGTTADAVDPAGGGGMIGPGTGLRGYLACGVTVLQPLIDPIDAAVMASDLLHANDTSMRVLDRSLRDKGLGKGVKKGRIRAYVLDQRLWAGTASPGVTCRFAPDWKEGHVLARLATAAAYRKPMLQGLWQTP